MVYKTKIAHYAAHALHFTVIVSDLDGDVPVLVNRMSELVDYDVQVWNGNLYKKTFAKANLKAIALFFEGRFPHYEVELRSHNYRPMAGCALDQFEMIELSRMTFARLNKLHEVNGTWKASFAPTEYEFKTYNPNFERMTYAEATRYGRALRSKLGPVLEEEKRVFQKREVVDFEDAMTRVSVISGMQEMNIQTMDNYLWLRHEIFSMICAHTLEIPAANTDRSFATVPDFRMVDWGLHNPRLTPDFIFKVLGEWHVVECAVSDGQMVEAYARKVNKYTGIVNHLSRSLNCKVTFTVLVLSSDREVHCSNPNELFDCLRSADFGRLLRLMKNVESVKNYGEARLQFDKVDPTELSGPIEMMTQSRTQFLEFLCTDKLHFKTLGFLRSFGYNGFDKPNLPTSMDVVDPVAEWKEIEANRLKNAPLDDFTEGEFMKKLISNHSEGVFSYEVDAMAKQTPAIAVAYLEKKLEEKNKLPLPQKIPKWLKIPIPPPNSLGVALPVEHEAMHYLADGSYILRASFKGFPDGERLDQAGLPVDEEAMHELSELVTILMETIGKGPFNSISDMFENTMMSHVFEMISEISYELMLLTNRRYAVKASSKQAIFKEYDRFSLMVAEGPKLSESNQCIFKVMFRSETGPVYNNISKSFRKFSDSELFDPSSDHYSTGWISLQLADLTHYSTIHERAKVILTDIWTRGIETKTFDMTELHEKHLPDFFMMPLIVLAEHKRNTMTCAQLSRYLMHSGTALVSDYTSLVDEIFDVPIRSVPNMMIVHHQCRWFKSMLLDRSKVNEYIQRSVTNDPRNDTFRLPSIYTPNKEVDFQVTMMEIYYGNMFNVYHGFRGHRDKEIMEKIIELEDHYRKVIKEGKLEREWSKVFFGKDTKCTYNPSFLKKAFEFYLTKKEHKALVQQASQHMLECGLGKLLKMTRSVLTTRDGFAEFMSSSGTDYNNKVTVFEAVLDTLLTIDEVKLLEIVKMDPVTYAIFTTFNKPQHGKGREILIQAIRTRIHTTMMNAFFEYLCNAHPKDMTTKESKKREIQSTTVLEFHNEATEISANSEDHSAFVFTINSDASKWAQSMVMMTYTFFINHPESPMNSNLKGFFTAMYASYSNKMIYIPDSLKNKIDQWSDTMVKEDQVIARAASYATSTGLMLIHSGMGQGNFQHGSGFVACLIDDYTDHLTDLVVRQFAVSIRTRTLNSSDDSTKLYLFECERDMMTPSFVTRMIYLIVDVFTGCRKMANIHINWKKTAVHLIITEFNSVFTILKRVYVASIKDSFNAINIPDMSRPEEAVKEAISNIRRLVDSGCYLETIRLAMLEMRRLLVKWMALTPEKVSELMSILECSADDLPFSLGFLPLEPAYEVLLYGPEIMIPKATGALKRFYEGVYSIPEETESLEDTDTEANCKWTFEVGGRADSQLIALKKMTSDAIDHDYEFWKEIMMVNSYSNSVLLLDFKNYLRSYIDSVKRTYGFSSTYRFHSLVRALQLWKTCTFTKDRSNVMTLVTGVKELVDKPKERSYLAVFESLNMILHESEVTNAMLARSNKKMFPFRHPKTRKLTMYKRDNTDVSKPEDVIKAILDPDPLMKSRYAPQIQEIAEMIGVTSDELMINPVSNMIRKFGKMPFSHLSEYCRWFCKLYEVKFISVISEFPTTFNRRFDLSGLYRYKSDPRFVYTDDDEAAITDVGAEYDNAMIVAELDDLETNEMNLLEPTTRKTHVYKMLATARRVELTSENTATFSNLAHNLANTRPLFTAKDMVKTWYSGSCMIRLQETTAVSPNIQIKVYGELDGMIIPLVKRELARMVMMDRRRRYEWITQYNERLVADYRAISDLDFREVKAFRMPPPIVEVKRTVAAWSATLSLPGARFNLWTGDHVYHPGRDFKPRYQERIRAIDNLTMSSCTLTEVDDLVKHLPGFSRSMFTEDNVATTSGELLAAFWAMESGASNPFTALANIQDDDEFDEEPDPNYAASIEGMKFNEFKSIMTQEMMDALTKNHDTEINLMNTGYDGVGLIARTLRTVGRAVREELTTSLQELRRSGLSVAKSTSVLMSVIRRDVKRDTDGKNFLDMTLLMITAAILKSSMLGMSLDKSSTVNFIPRERLASIAPHSIVRRSQLVALMFAAEALDDTGLI